MISGFDDLSLALFTTLAPAGAFGFICLAIALLRPAISSQDKCQLNKFLAIPLAVVLIGFIASATHLGTPANALYVFTGIGRSPLSNEVFAIVVFLLLAGSYWMFSFKPKLHTALYKVWIVVACAAAAVFIATTSVAYSVGTVPTWNTPFAVPILLLSAALGGAILAFLSKAFARYEAKWFDNAMLVVAGLAFVVGLAVLFAHNVSLANLANNEVVAAQLVPEYFGTIWAYAALGLLGLACAMWSSRKTIKQASVLVLRVTGYLFVSVAVFLTRLVFYGLHMTVGY